MLNNIQLTDILNLLKLNYYEENGKILILNPKTKDVTISKPNDKNGYKFNIGNRTCYFNDSLFILNKKDTEFIINGIDTCYLKRNPNTLCITKTFNLNDNTVSFYNYSNDTSTGLTLYYNKEYNFYRMRKFESITDENGICKKEQDFDIQNNDFIKHIIRQYDSNNKMIKCYSFANASIIPVQECIDEELKTNSIISEMIDEMENTIPGITNYCDKLNPIMKEIIEKSGKHIVTK